MITLEANLHVNASPIIPHLKLRGGEINFFLVSRGVRVISFKTIRIQTYLEIV